MILHLRFLFLIVVTSFLFSCSADDESIDMLPPKTRTGEQTLGFKINGETYILNGTGTNLPRVYYQEMNGKYFLTIGADFIKDDQHKTIQIVGQDLKQLEEKAYVLEEREASKIWAGYYEGSSDVPYSFFTTNEVTGNLIITKLDQEKFIISGEFYFTALNEDGNLIKIRDGRFDLNYAK